jgi:hypothetical protein
LELKSSKFDTSNTNIDDSSFSWLGIGTSI